MITARKRKRQQGDKLIAAIKAIERAASTAMKIYWAVEPIAKAIWTKRRKTK
jgi:hypothetical protein